MLELCFRFSVRRELDVIPSLETQLVQRAFTLTLNVLAGATLYSHGRRYSKVSDAIPAETAVSRNSCVTGAPAEWLVWAFFFVELFTSLRGEGSPFIAQVYPVDGLLFSRSTSVSPLGRSISFPSSSSSVMVTTEAALFCGA